MRRDKYLPTTTFKIIHDYFEVKSVAFEDKSIDIKFSENIKIYQISVNKHGTLGDSSEPIMIQNIKLLNPIGQHLLIMCFSV